MSESLTAYIFERPFPKDGRGPVIIVSCDLDEARKIYRQKASEKMAALLQEFGRENDCSFDQLIEEDLRTAEVQEVALRPGTVLLDQGM